MTCDVQTPSFSSEWPSLHPGTLKRGLACQQVPRQLGSCSKNQGSFYSFNSNHNAPGDLPQYLILEKGVCVSCPFISLFFKLKISLSPLQEHGGQDRQVKNRGVGASAHSSPFPSVGSILLQSRSIPRGEQCTVIQGQWDEGQGTWLLKPTTSY